MRLLLDLLFLASTAALATFLVVRGSRMLVHEDRLARRLLTLADAPEEATEPGAETSKATWQITTLLGSGKEREEVEQLLNAAGWRGAQALMIFAILRLALPLILGAAALWLAADNPMKVFIAIAAAAAGFLAPKQILRLAAANRARRIRAELPFTLDLLVMMLESGVAIDQAFRTFAEGDGRATPLTQAATRLLVRDLDRGAPHELALARWADRLPVPGARDLARVIVRSLRHGAPLGPTLKAFAREFGELRIAKAREAVGRASAKMTLAMLVLIMPALFIVLAGPAVATLGAAIRATAGAH